MSYDYNTAEVEYSSIGLSVGKHKVMIVGEEFINNLEKPDNPNMLKVTYEAVEGDEKGKTTIAYYNHQHKNVQTRNISRETIKLIGDATGGAVNAQRPLKNRVLQIEVAQQKANDKYTEITTYYTEDGSRKATRKGLESITSNLKEEIPS
jgi:hypothetical protein